MSDQLETARTDIAQAKSAPKTAKKKAKKPSRTPAGPVTIKTPNSGKKLRYNPAAARAIAVLRVVSAGAFDLDAVTKRSKMPRRAAYHHLWCLRLADMVKSERLSSEDEHELVFASTPRGDRFLAKR